MTRIRPIPNTTDPAGLRLELELVLFMDSEILDLAVPSDWREPE